MLNKETFFDYACGMKSWKRWGAYFFLFTFEINFYQGPASEDSQTSLSLPQAICFPLSNYKWTLHRSHIMLAVAWILSLLFRRVSRFIHHLQQIAIHANWLAILSKFYEFCQINQFGEIEKLQKWFRIRQIIQQWNPLSSDSIPVSFFYSVSVYRGTSTCTPNWGVDWGAKVRIKYRGGINFRSKVLWILFLLLLTTSASTCLKNSCNLGMVF